MKNLKLFIILALLFLSFGLNLFFIFQKPQKTDQPDFDPANLPYLSPRIFAEQQNDRLINFIPLREKLNDYLKTVDATKGVYFEYLPTGVSIGINEKEPFYFASLLKIPVVMAVYKKIEKGPLKISDKITVKEEHLNKNYGDLYKRGFGYQLSISELFDYTLVNSDNTANHVLNSLLTQADILEVFAALDIPAELLNNQPVVTTKNYSSILRSLYLSSYLDKASSNDILDRLTKSDFNEQLDAGVPDQIKVAHKIGFVEEPNTKVQIHSDCGIIYVAKRPYILCLMFKGEKAAADQFMANVSRLVYDFVSTVNN